MTIDIGTRRGTPGVLDAATALAAGRPVVVVDDDAGEGDLVFPAEHATTTVTAFAIRHTSGHLGVALPDDRCRRLRLAAASDVDGRRSAQCVSVDLVGTGTGISAASRGATITALADPARGHEAFSRPGHVVPFRVEPGGLSAHRGRPEAAFDLAVLGGLSGIAATATVVSVENPCEMAGPDELVDFAARYGLEIVTISEIVAARRRHGPVVERVAVVAVPSERGQFEAIGYRGLEDGADHVALRTGRLEDGGPVPVHVQVECLSGNVLRSRACTCRAVLDDALTAVAEEGRGVVLNLRPSGVVHACGRGRSAADRSIVDTAAAILRDLGAGHIRSLGIPPSVVDGLRAAGLLVDVAAPQAMVG